MLSKPFYKWIICIGLIVLMFCTIGLTFSAFSIYMPYIRDLRGFTNFQTSMIVTIRTLSSIVAVLFVEKYLAKTGLRNGILISMIGVGASFLIYSFSTNYAGFVIAAALCGAMYSLSGTAAASLAITRWFKTGRGTAMGIASAGSGVSSIVAPIIIVPIIKNMSLSSAFMIEAFFIFACTVFVFIVVRNYPPGEEIAEKKVAENSAAIKKEKLYITSKNMTVIAMIAMFLIGVIIYAITGFMSMTFAEHFGGEQLAFLSTVYGLALMMGKIAFGKLADKIGTLAANFMLYVPVAVGLIGAPFAVNYGVALLMAILLGAGSPISAVAIPIYANDLSNPNRLVAGLKYFNLIQGIAGFVISFVIGYLADVFGTYRQTYIATGVIAIITLILIQIVYISVKRNQVKSK